MYDEIISLTHLFYMNESQTPNLHAAKTTRIVKWALIVAIVVVLNLFFNYAISLVYKQPAFEKFCSMELTSKTYTDKVMCTEAGGQWTENTYPVTVEDSKIDNPVKVAGYCNATYTCNQKYMDAESVYNRNVFIVLVILGILSLIFGTYMTNYSSVVSLGFSLGGVISLVIGAMRYWSNMQDVLRVVVLACALAALVWIGIRKIKD